MGRLASEGKEEQDVDKWVGYRREASWRGERVERGICKDLEGPALSAIHDVGYI